MKIYCKKCGEIIVEGEIVQRKNKQRFDLYGKLNGSILKNNSNNPEDWTGFCSKCQSEFDKSKSK